MPEEERLITCPYNVAHVIIANRMSGHLTKCRKQYPGTLLKTCPIDATHQIPEPELQYHISNDCERKINLDSAMYRVGEPTVPIAATNTLAVIHMPDSSENWDEEQTPVSYLDIREDILQREAVLRLPTGQSKAQRRNFVLDEIRRFDELKMGEVPEPSYKVKKEKKVSKPQPPKNPANCGSSQEVQHAESAMKNRRGVGRGIVIDESARLELEDKTLCRRGEVQSEDESQEESRGNENEVDWFEAYGQIAKSVPKQSQKEFKPKTDHRTAMVSGRLESLRMSSMNEPRIEPQVPTEARKADEDDDGFQLVVRSHKGRGRGGGGKLK